MARLTAAERHTMPASSFALPGRRMFPVHDENHARAALQGVERSLKAGHISEAEAHVVRSRARAKLRG